MIYFMNKGVWSHLMIGEHKTKGVKVDSRTQVQIGEIKFNFLLPHQGALPQDPLPGEEKESSEELTTPSITSPTPPPETEKTLLKPDIPYPTLIAQSLLSHPRRRRTLPDIYKWIADHHPYFNQRAGNRSWQSSIRQNLVNNQAFVLYDDGGQVTGKTKRSKRAKEEWGISPEYEGLIGNLTATEDDTEKLSTKLAKKAAQPKTPKPPKHPKPPPKPKDKEKPKQQSPAVSPPPPQAQTEEASRVEEITRRMQGKGVDMSALLAEAFAKMKAVPLKPPQPSPQPPQLPAAKRPKPNPPPKVASPSTCPPSRVINQPTTATKNSNNQPQLPITMPMPLPYTTKAAPIPTIGSTPVVQVKKESTPVVVPVPVASPSLPTPSPAPPPATNATTESDLSSMSPQTIDLPDPSIKPAITSDIPPPNGIKAAVAATPIPAKPVETAASRRQPRGKKRALES
jgi:hypothetical protein